MVKAYAPKLGDVVWLDFDPQSGYEQKGRRPALVVSPEKYNAKVGLAILCPITSRVKGYPFEVRISVPRSVDGAILADQVKNLDWSRRRAKFICRAPDEVLAEVLAKLQTLIAE
jgi:mRNA interferase MazF